MLSATVQKNAVSDSENGHRVLPVKSINRSDFRKRSDGFLLFQYIFFPVEMWLSGIRKRGFAPLFSW